MLYPKNTFPFAADLFLNPTNEYRGMPFWAWNCKLDAQELEWQIDELKKMGFGGFHMHVRTGMATEYLSDEYMNIVKTCVKKAETECMQAWLYDEDRWPSGTAGGFVTRRHHQYRAKHLLLTRSPYGTSGTVINRYESSARAIRTGNGKLIACFDVKLNSSGEIAGYKKIDELCTPEGFILYAYEETALPSPWFNNQTYVNTLDPDAIREFIRITHERYHNKLNSYFGGIVPAIFTDEPQFAHKGMLRYAHEDKDVTLPWTSDLPETYRAVYKESLIDFIPELLWDLPGGKVSVARYRYHDHVAERFASAFADQCGAWCKSHGLMLTGHMMEEPTLESQTAALGETMRSYRSFQLPGIDMLCDRREFTTAKQAQSAARQYGCPGVLSELYGVTNWDFDFRGHKLQGDWQAALGVTTRVPHLSWISMNGEAKRDYPATFNYQSPWYEEYSYIETHFARVNTAMTRGKSICRVGVIHPVESYWLHWGAKENTASIRRQMEINFRNLAEWLLRGLIDFDFICESLLKEQCRKEAITGNKFSVGEMGYDVVIVPALETIRSTTIEQLETFMRKGGRVIFLGGAPTLVDAVPDGRCRNIWELGERLPFERMAILSALEDVREVEIRESSGALTEELLYQLREEADCRWLFIAHADVPHDKDNPHGDIIQIKVRGAFGVRLYDTVAGDIRSLPAKIIDGWTVLRHPIYEHDSILLRLERDSNIIAGYKNFPQLADHRVEGKTRFLDPVPVTLHEPNVLLLDMAEFALNDESYRPAEEILRLDNILRGELGWPLRGEAVAQPWTDRDAVIEHTLRLRFVFFSRLVINVAVLAMENADIVKATLNGLPVGGVNGWYVDKCIGRTALPSIEPGKNVIELTMPYSKKIDVEACYLLGDFGVQVSGCNCMLTEPVRELCFGDITRQGLPFYGGNLTYHMEAETKGDIFEISATCYRGHLLRVAIDGVEAGIIALSPYRLTVKGVNPGRHKIDLTFFGNRVNTFGQLHRNDRCDQWWGPDSWRTTGTAWTYEYRFWPQGVLKSPEIF